MTKEQTLAGAQGVHQAALDAGRFLIQHCSECGRHVYFPREICPHCGSAALQWVEPTGYGTVYAVTTVRRKTDAGGDYNISLVDLDEGVRMMSRVAATGAGPLCIGQRVSSRVLVTEGRGLVLFDVVSAQGAAGGPA